jgi:hypothetical protein
MSLIGDKSREAEMVDKKHVAMLKRSGEDWNQWRNAHPRILPRLAGVNLVGAGLAGANLVGASLAGAILEEANFKGANLTGVDLPETRGLKTKPE